MVSPSFMKEAVQDGYYIKTINRQVLEELDVPHVEAEHSSMESAMSEINVNRDKLKHLTLTVLPVIAIAWDGEIAGQ